MAEGYKATLRESSRELSPIEKFRVTDMGNAQPLDVLTNDGPLLIDYAFYAVVDVVNPMSKDNQEYTKYVVGDKAGNLYITSSDSFYTQLQAIIECMGDADGWMLEVFQKASSNYPGRNFLTATVTEALPSESK